MLLLQGLQGSQGFIIGLLHGKNLYLKIVRILLKRSVYK